MTSTRVGFGFDIHRFANAPDAESAVPEAEAKVETEAEAVEAEAPDLYRFRDHSSGSNRAKVEISLPAAAPPSAEPSAAAPALAKPLILGGVCFEDHPGLIGHSDADVICHAITDAILGAAQLGDMGEHFSDTDPRWKGANSIELLRQATELVSREGWSVGNVDCTLVAESPKIAPHRGEMQRRLSEATGAPVSVKATRAEGLGALGRVEGAACWAVVMLSESSSR